MVAAANPSASSTRDLRHFNFGSSDPVLKVHEPPTSQQDSFDVIFALNEDVQVTPSGNVPASNELLEEENNATEDPEDGFYYQGLAQGSFSGRSSLNILAWLFNLISQLVDYVLGFMTMIIKVVIIGWANIFVNIVTEAVNALTGDAVEEKVDDTNTTDITEPNVVTSGNSENQTQSILDNDNLYTPSSTELQPEGDDKLTVDKIIFNQVPLLDVNMFSETAAGYTLKDESSLKIIRDSVATWYYAIRNLTIAIMLIILIYIGIKMAISTVASEKAEYKRMLGSWLVGFLIIFVIHFFLIFVLNLNSTILGWIMDAQQSMGYEDSIYETVRTKAYEIKFSSGMIGTILYIVLIVLMLKFLYIYIKRLLGVCILIIMAPTMGASYAISKVRTGKAKPFVRWMKDFTLLVQSVHALIYTCFVTVVLQLTNESMAGIMIALLVMNFMFKATSIFTSIFGMVGDKTGSRTLETIVNSDPRKEILGGLFVAGEVGKSAKAFASGTIQFGKDLKNSVLNGGRERKRQLQAQALGIGNLGKKALGKTWLGTRNINTATGQYVPRGKAERLTSLSSDLDNVVKETREKRKKERSNFVKDLYTIHDSRLSNALKIATSLPFMGVAGLEELGATNLATVLVGGGKRGVKKPRKGIKAKFSSARSAITERRNQGKGMIRATAGAAVGGVKNIAIDKTNKMMKPGEKIQDEYENRMAKINEAKEAETNIIDLYTRGRREKEESFKSLKANGLNDKAIKTMARKSFDDSYRKTLNDVFEVSDIVDERVDREQHLQRYKAELGIDDKTLGKNSIDTIKQKVENRVRDNISDKLRDKYAKENNNKIDSVTEVRIKQETEERVSEFMKDLDKEIDDKTVKDENLANDPSVIKGDRFDFSETIKADELKSTIEDMMKKHGAEKKAEDGMEELREQMQRLQRIDRDYASVEGNKDKSYLYKASTDIRKEQEKHSNLKTVLSSLTYRNIDINNGGRR